jgi:hypothetical protein
MATQTVPQLTWANIITTIAVILTMFAGAWMLFQSQFANLKEEFSAADASQVRQIADLRKILKDHMDNSVLRPEHTEFVKRLDGEISAMREQLKILETTRPTTGELQGIGLTTKEQLTEIKARVQSLEDNLRRPQALAPVTPPVPVPAH